LRRDARILRVLQAVLAAALTGAACACLSSNPSAGSSGAAPPAVVTAIPTTVVPKTAVSQPQPGSTGAVFSGVVTYQGAPPPTQSSLYLALVKAATDPNQRPCIDAARDPLDNSGQFSAQVACSPQSGDQLYYVLVIGPEGQRNWHSGALPLPADLTKIRIDVPDR
jgi:hypothetical protein